jgi:hypothetical protein
MSENSRTNYILAPVTLSAAVGWWVGCKALGFVQDHTPGIRNRTPEDFMDEFVTYADRPRSLGLIARRMAQNLDNPEYLKNAAAEMAYRSASTKTRFTPGQSGENFDHSTHLANIMRGRGIPDDHIDEVLSTEAVQKIMEDPSAASPPPVRTL